MIDARMVKDNGKSVSEKLAETLTVVNIKALGAKGDGIADDRQYFLDALEKLKLAGGGILYVPPTLAKYRITNHIQWDETYGHIIVQGAGRNSHVYLSQKSTNGHLFGIIGSATAEANWVKGATIKDLQVSTYDGTGSQDDNPIGIAKAKNVLIENVYVSFSNWKGITAQTNVKNITFKDCEVEKCKKIGLGTEFSTVSDIKVINCTVHDCTEQGALFTAAGDGGTVKGLVIRGLTAYKNVKEGLGLATVHMADIDGVVSYDNRGNGVKTFAVTKSKIKGQARNNDLAGILVQQGSENDVEMVNENNSLVDGSIRGNFFLDTSPRTRLINCNGRTGNRALTNWSDNCIFVGCDFEGATNAIAESANPAATKIVSGCRGI